jgi:uncharacterized membrane protein YphA (DoxX/SURF4 family)
MSGTVGILLLFGRLILGWKMTMNGISHFRRSAMYTAMARTGLMGGDPMDVRVVRRMPFPYLAGWPAGLWLIAGAASLMLGVWPDLGAVMIAFFVVLVNYLVVGFWRVNKPSPHRAGLYDAFTRNIIYVGYCVVLVATFGAFGNIRLALTRSFFELR